MSTFSTLAISYRFARHMRGWKFWLWPSFMLRFVRYQSAKVEMDEMEMPEDEQKVLRDAWLYGDATGYTEYPECQKCWMRFDPDVSVKGKKPTDGICVPCQEVGDRILFIECVRCQTLYAPDYSVVVENEIVVAENGVCASCLATDLLIELEKTKTKTQDKELQ